MTTTTEAPYAICVEEGCGEEFTNRAEAQTHAMMSLNAATPDEHGNKSGHGFRIINPPPEEARANRIDSAISWEIETAVADVLNNLWRMVEREEATTEEVADELRWRGEEWSDGWAEYVAEMDS